MFELLLTLMIAGVATLSAVLSFPAITTSIHRGEAREAVSSVILRARSEAASAGARGVLTIDNSTGAVTFGLDNRPWSTAPEADTVVFRSLLPRGVTLSQETLLFDPRGDLIDEESLPTSVTITLAQLSIPFGEVVVYPTGAVQFRSVTE